MNRQTNRTLLIACTLLAVVLILAIAGAALAQVTSYSLDWWTVDGGGGAASGGAYTLGATAGQADAGSASGGGFTLDSGFWPGAPPRYTTFLPAASYNVSP